MPSILKDKSYKFALRIVNLYKFLKDEKKEFIMSKQLMRSGTSVGALIREAEHAQYTADYINKLSIALKEASETSYWLSLLKDSEYLTEKMHKSIEPDIEEILKLLISSIKTLKKKLKR